MRDSTHERTVTYTDWSSKAQTVFYARTHLQCTNAETFERSYTYIRIEVKHYEIYVNR